MALGAARATYSLSLGNRAICGFKLHPAAAGEPDGAGDFFFLALVLPEVLSFLAAKLEVLVVLAAVLEAAFFALAWGNGFRAGAFFLSGAVGTGGADG